jgi:hypothetical protein
VHLPSLCPLLAGTVLVAACARNPHPEFGAATPSCPATGSPIAVRGTVRDTAGIPIQGVDVLVTAARAWSRTDARGQYVLATVPPGPVQIRAQSIGYSPRMLSTCADPGDGKVMFIDFVLGPSSIGFIY